MDTTSARMRAVAFSLAIHVLVAFVLYWGLLAQPEFRNAAGEGPAIEAMLVTAPRSGPVSQSRHAQQPRPQPPAPRPPASQPPARQPPQEQPRQRQSQTQVPKPDTVDQDEVRRNAQLAAEQAQKEQDERRRQAQVDLDRKQEQLEAENRQQQADAAAQAKKLAAVRALLAEQQRKAQLAQEKMKQDQDMRQMLAQNAAPAVAPAQHPATAGGGGDAGLLGKYKQAIIDVVNQNWHHDGVPERTHCEVHFKQLPGGEVFGDVTFGNCPFDAAARASVEDALKKTPLPYAGYEKVFQRQGTIDMCYPEEACK